MYWLFLKLSDFCTYFISIITLLLILVFFWGYFKEINDYVFIVIAIIVSAVPGYFFSLISEKFIAYLKRSTKKH
tara:strand:- start:1254 stop:1475 length:222 start_codon:yes stop_codon:yes gene_type:complete